MRSCKCILSAFTLSAVFSFAIVQGQTVSADGTWTGSLRAGGGTEPITLTITGASGAIDRPAENIAHSPLDRINFEPNTNHLELLINNASVQGASFHGTLIQNCIIGTWAQNGVGQPLTLCRSGTTIPANLEMTDLSGFSEQRPAIERMLAQGIMSSTSPGHFTPTGSVTRADFAATLQRLFALNPTTHVTFSDVPNTHPGATAIEAAAPFMNRQIFCFGCQLTTKFLPNKTVTRAEAVVFVVRVLGAQGKVKPIAASDVPVVAGSAADAATWGPLLAPFYAVALKGELISLEPDSKLHPEDALQRAHAAVLFDKAQSLASIPVR